MSNIFNNLITKIKSKKSSINNKVLEEYAFSLEEIDNLQEENKQKIKNLKEDKIGLKKETTSVLDTLKFLEKKTEEIENKENINEIIESENTEVKEDTIEDEQKEVEEKDNLELEQIEKIEEISSKEQKINKEKKLSFINLTKEEQDIITKSFKELNLKELDKDILEAKDILNHNYNIAYPERAAKLIHNIRKKYETLISYLIGFNNEKNGIENKIIFSNKLDNEWNYLENYIKLLEKMRSFIK